MKIQVTLPMKPNDRTIEAIIKIINSHDEPMETGELQEILSNVTRNKILLRLRDLRGDGLIRGKRVGAAKGTWIWWRKDAFTEGEP